MNVCVCVVCVVCVCGVCVCGVWCVCVGVHRMCVVCVWYGVCMVCVVCVWCVRGVWRMCVCTFFIIKIISNNMFRSLISCKYTSS